MHMQEINSIKSDITVKRPQIIPQLDSRTVMTVWRTRLTIITAAFVLYCILQQ